MFVERSFIDEARKVAAAMKPGEDEGSYYEGSFVVVRVPSDAYQRYLNGALGFPLGHVWNAEQEFAIFVVR